MYIVYFLIISVNLGIGMHLILVSWEVLQNSHKYLNINNIIFM